MPRNVICNRLSPQRMTFCVYHSWARRLRNYGKKVECSYRFKWPWEPGQTTRNARHLCLQCTTWVSCQPRPRNDIPRPGSRVSLVHSRNITAFWIQGRGGGEKTVSLVKEVQFHPWIGPVPVFWIFGGVRWLVSVHVQSPRKVFPHAWILMSMILYYT